MIHSKFKCEFRDCVCKPHAFCLGLWQTHSPSCSLRIEFYIANQPRSNAGVDSVSENKTSPSSRLPPEHVPQKVFPSFGFQEFRVTFWMDVCWCWRLFNDDFCASYCLRCLGGRRCWYFVGYFVLKHRFPNRNLATLR